jgi:hypothetical protein
VYVALNLFAVAPSSEPCPVNTGLGSHREPPAASVESCQAV